MNCEEIRELILTDYLDGEMNDDQKIRMSIHFARCHHCKEFFLNAKESVDEAFAHIDRFNPPEVIWQKIKETIMAEQQKKPSFADTLWRSLKSLLYIPQPYLALATVIILMFVVGITAHLKVSRQEALKASTEGQIESFVYSLETPADILINDEEGLRTLIEKYFL